MELNIFLKFYKFLRYFLSFINFMYIKILIYKFIDHIYKDLNIFFIDYNY